ncbi:DUF883 family protein [Parvularcula marina]|uniref:DUF883 domain-containing protein n=1 Tax=Parvularcula marina TaxID=2292771 RepID=A0A371RI66_9PROT|nr:hypothetical protein [Parvularcula marina]RFB05154.1 hypothetical protein DX908_07740 [Parvularcula marina]
MNTQTTNVNGESHDLDTLRADVSALRADLQTLLSDAGKVAGEFADSGMKRGKEAASRMSSAGKDGIAKAENSVKDHPVAALGIAFAFGALLGFAKRK